MKRPDRRPAHVILVAVFMLFSLGWGGFLGARQIAGRDPGIDRFENLTVDWRFAMTGPRPPPHGVVIAAIDDETVQAAGGYPLRRDLLARIVRGLAAGAPRAIAVDLLFLDPGDPAADRELTAALALAPSVVGAVAVYDAGEPEPRTMRGPVPTIAAATRPGVVNIATDRSGVPRHVPMLFRIGDRVFPSFVLAAVAMAANVEPVFGAGTVQLSGAPIPLDRGATLPIRYYGPPGGGPPGGIARFSAARALTGTLDPDAVRGQIVVLGVTASGAGDIFATPFDRVVPGVEVLATAIGNILDGGGLIRDRFVRRIDTAIAILLPIAVVLSIAIRGPFLGTILIGLWLSVTTIAFDRGYWLNIAGPMAVLLPAVLGYLALRTVLDQWLARQLAGDAAALAKFQSPALVRHLTAYPSFLAQPERRDVGVIFLDLSGFTGVAETLGPEWTRELLAALHTLIEREAAACGGYVASFMGDGAMILFGLLEAQSNAAVRTLNGVTALHRSIDAWLANLPPAARDRLGVRVGGHFGPVILSRLGSEHHRHVAATGDTVNVASRLLEVAKELKAQSVVSADLLQAAGSPDGSAAREVAIRGRVAPLLVHVWVVPPVTAS